MRSPQFEEPHLFAIQAGELPLSGQALLVLMRAVLAKGLPFRFCARGWSMVPFIQDGDVITVTPVQDASPGMGEIVAFMRPDTGNPVVHRVIGRRGAAVWIRGDGVVAHSDGIIPLENLLGRVVRIERNGKDIWLGLGPERLLIAWFSRARLLIPFQLWLAAWRKRFS